MNLGDGSFDDRTYQAGLGINTRLLGWGVSFIDIDNDGWLDILVANGHVYPEVDGTQVDAAYAERKYLYRNLRNGQFEDVSLTGGQRDYGCGEGARLRGGRLRQRWRSRCGGELRECRAATAALRFDAEAKLDKDAAGGKEIEPDGDRGADQGGGADGVAGTHREAWRRRASQSRTLTQIEEVRSCNGYYSASDLRIHFGLNDAKKVDLVEIRWPSGAVDTLKDLDVNRLYVIEEGGKILKNEVLAVIK